MDDVADLYVDLDDRAAVGGVLAEVDGLVVEQVGSSEGLGLARLAVRAPGGWAPVLAPLIESSAAPIPAEAGSVEELSIPQQLDVLVDYVRGHAPEGFAGRWNPTIDRNHDVTEHGTNPHVKIADDVPPAELTPVTPSDRVPHDQPTGPRVGVADALLFAHPHLVGRFVGESLDSPGPYPAPGPGHAAVVAGTVLRRCPKAQLVARPVLQADGPNGSWEVAERLLAFLDDDLEVLNMSFGCVSDGRPSLPLERAMGQLGRRMVLVTALGNYEAGEDLDPPHYPAAFDNVVAVGAAANDGAPADITPRLPWLDILAPKDVVGPFLIGRVKVKENGESVDRDYASGYVSWAGSSFSAAAVSGAIAQLMLQNDVDAATARDALLSGAARVPGITDLQGA